MTETSSGVEQQRDLVERPERTPEDIKAGREKIEQQIEQSIALEKAHLKIEEQERANLEARIEQALAQLDNSPVGKAYEKLSGGTRLSQAKQTPWGTIGANTLQGGQSLFNIIRHPIQTTKAVGQFFISPRQSIKQVASMYKDEWDYSNGWGKIGVAWRGAFEVVFGAKGAGTISKVGKLGYQAGKLGKLGAIVQKGTSSIGTVGTKTGEIAMKAIPTVAIKAGQKLAQGVQTVGEKIPNGIKNTTGRVIETTKEQSRIRPLDNPLDGTLSKLKQQGAKIEKTASVAGEAEIFGEKIPQPKIWTKAEKLAARPKNIEVHRWNILTKDYPKYTPEQLQKTFKIENFLMENGIDERYLKRVITSMDIDFIKIIDYSSENIIAYRFYGGNSNKSSYYYATKDLRFIPEHEIKDFLALPDNNAIDRVSQVIIPKGSPILIGKISSQKVDNKIFLIEKLGGSEQIYYPLKDKNVKIISDYNFKKLQNGN